MAYKNYIMVCTGTGCESSKAGELYKNLEAELKAAGVDAEAQLVKTGCFGFCEQGPIVKILPDETFYVKVKPADAKEIVAEHIVKGRKVDRLVYQEPNTDTKPVNSDDIGFYRKQFRIVLRNCAVINPEIIDEYIARDGYAALEKALFEMTPDTVLEEIKASGLRGRGGAGFSTGMKWGFTKGVKADQKYIVCNADEGDPGAYMDRSVLEGDPHSVLEAMTIAGYTVGASKGFIYIRAEYPLAIDRLNTAMKQAREYGLLGDNILGTDFSFDIEIRLGAGAFVCGEETALLASIEGNRGMPIPRPPFPAIKGLWGKPTVINNVETWANIPMILLKGAKWFSSIGTETSKGTKVFALTGKIKNSGLIEVPMGTTLREIIFDIGGGIPGGKSFKAAQTGGPSGGCITPAFLDTPIDYESLMSIGSMMGSGGMIVMNEDDCMIDVTKFYLEFTVDESCGKCAPCRIGGRTCYNILDRISKGQGEIEDLQKLKDIGHAMRKASLCGLGQTAPNPILATMKYFEEEYREHIEDHKCAAGKCKSMLSYTINDKCVGCTACARVCPVSCISGDVKQKHVIDQDKCIKCGQCFDKCKFGAIDRA
jgi:NADH:ubiquinone oxidoreductase subunit F (NADH-binding)/(2Fe-2S) ferredoxin/NAD-dependent dihydropyrimidine dehydrogenase PreA subunit